jgi:hypothetical protein
MLSKQYEPVRVRGGIVLAQFGEERNRADTVLILVCPIREPDRFKASDFRRSRSFVVVSPDETGQTSSIEWHAARQVARSQQVARSACPGKSTLDQRVMVRAQEGMKPGNDLAVAGFRLFIHLP